MAGRRGSGRQKIIDAASDLARETGPGNLSLDAVAARAGVSKGGLLYHFPTKTRLLEAMVGKFLEEFAEELSTREATRAQSPDRLIAAYLDLFVEQYACQRPPPSGILAALAEDPGFIAPVRRLERSLLDRMTAESADFPMALIVYLAIHGIRSMQLLGLDSLTGEDVATAIARLREMIDDGGTRRPKRARAR